MHFLGQFMSVLGFALKLLKHVLQQCNLVNPIQLGWSPPPHTHTEYQRHFKNVSWKLMVAVLDISIL